MSDKLIKVKHIIFVIACVFLVFQLVGCAEENDKLEKGDSMVGKNSVEESVNLEKPEDNESTNKEKQQQEEPVEKVEKVEEKKVEGKNTQVKNDEKAIEAARPVAPENSLEENNKQTQSNKPVEKIVDEDSEYYYGEPAKKLSPSYEAALLELAYEPFERELVRLLMQDSGITFKEAVETVRPSYIPTPDLDPFQGGGDEFLAGQMSSSLDELDPSKYQSEEKLAPEYEEALMNANMSEYQKGRIRYLVHEDGLSFEEAVVTILPGSQVIYKME